MESAILQRAFLYSLFRTFPCQSPLKVNNGMTIQEACQRLGKSESTIRRMIKAGKLVANMKDGAYNILEDSINDLSNDKQSVVNDKLPNELVKQLQDENQYLKERIKELESSRERADMISIQLTRQLEQSQRMLEAHKEPFWRRWFKHKPENFVRRRNDDSKTS